MAWPSLRSETAPRFPVKDPEKFVELAEAVAAHGANWLADEFAARLAAGPVRWDLEVSVASASDDAHDPTSRWKPVEVFVAGTLTVDAVAPDPEADGAVVVFDPTRIIPGIELSDDPILLFRKGVYAASARHRSGH